MLLENDLYPQDSRVRREARALIAAGYQVTVIGPAGPGQPGYELIDGVRIRRFAAPPDGQGLLGYAHQITRSFIYSAARSLRLSEKQCRRLFDSASADLPGGIEALLRNGSARVGDLGQG